MTLFTETQPPADQPYPVPENWVWVKLKYLGNYINGRAFKPSDWSSQGLPIIRIQNLNNPDAEFNYCDFQVEEKFLIRDEDLLFAWSGTPGTSFGAHIWKGGNAVLNQHIFRIEFHDRLIGRYFFKYALNYVVDDFIRKAHGSAGLAHITKKTFEESVIPLPPLPEQQRIVKKLDALLGKLREARTLIDEARESFALRRAAILHKAFSGKLTEAWRADHPEVESAKLFVHELFKEKRTYSKGKHQEYRFHNIPETWKTVELGAIVNVHSGENLTKSNMVMDGGIPVYGGNGITGYHNTYNVAQHTIVIGRVGYYCGSVHLTEEKAWATDNAFIVKFSEQQMNLSYLFWLLTYSNLGQTSNSSAQPVISGKTIYPVIVPLPPLSEQCEIARRIESLLGHETDAAGLLDMDDELDLLEQSLLSRAFRGELGTNDPAEPPAMV